MSAAYSTLTLLGMLGFGSSRLTATGSPASNSRSVGIPVRLFCTSAGSEWQLVQLASPDMGNTASTVVNRLPPRCACTRTSG